MIGCRSSGRTRFIRLGLLAALACVLPDAAPAQTRGPILLGPPVPLGPAAPTGPGAPAVVPTPPAVPPAASAPAASAPGAAPATPPSSAPPPAADARTAAPRTTADGAIRIEGLSRLTADAAGTLTPDRGGLRTDLWNGTPGRIALRLVALLPASPDSPALRGLQRRLLLSSGPAPADIAEGELLVERARRLLAMGALDELGALAAVVPGRDDDPALARVMVERALAAGEDAAACDRHDAIAGRADDRFWVKVGVVCDLRRGDAGKAELGVRLLAEIGQADGLLQELVQLAVAGRGTGPHRLTGASPVHLAAARVAGLAIDPDVSAIDSLAVLVALARGAGNPPFAARLAAADRAERSGAVATEVLTALYAEVAVQGGSIDGALKVAEADPGAYGRALLWRAADATADPAQRVRVIRKALEIAGDAAAWRQTARVFAPLIRRLAAGPATAEFAPDAVRALVAAGDAAAARPWLDWLAARAAAGNPTARAAASSAWMVARIAGGDRLAPYQEAAVSEWWDGLRASEPGRASDLGAASLTLMHALGAPIGADAWRGLAGAPPTLPYEAPTAAFRNGVTAGAAAGRLAETVALACAGFGAAPLEDIDPTAVAGVAAALRRLGLEDDARRLAGEAAVAYGL